MRVATLPPSPEIWAVLNALAPPMTASVAIGDDAVKPRLPQRSAGSKRRRPLASRPRCRVLLRLRSKGTTGRDDVERDDRRDVRPATNSTTSFLRSLQPRLVLTLKEVHVVGGTVGGRR